MPDNDLMEMIMRMLTKLESVIEEFRESNRVNTIKNQADLKNAVIKMKNTLEEVNSRLANTDKRISDLEYRLVEINQQNRSTFFSFQKMRII